ncbi:hypothetical protein GGS23DRAFT_593117 [Durotheca rogersii]|uniref:uncharacterized protein n=1 Tax=Durotheca rogersii TaxID=419775 RepID=UPI00221EC915|nr:uncharacterized protein GGS23DRAFT_593117 [Durotheca rogersii]KAI5867850.1 hypothetical protein GGS23DRAFT_593117 [Durotheca rogersii]
MSVEKGADATLACPPLDEYGAAPPPYAATAGTDGADAPAYSWPAEAGRVAGASGRFPAALNAYFPKTGLSRTLHLGQRADAPLLAVTTHSGLTSRPLLELRARAGGPVIASADNESRWGCGRTSIVKVVGGGSLAAAAEGAQADEFPAPPLREQTVVMRQRASWTHLSYGFSAAVGRGKDLRPEDFEWRRSRGPEVRQVNGGAGLSGWKLVRLAAGHRSAEGGKGAAGEASGAGEVVAVWSHNASASMTKVLRFQLVGSAAAGLLGDEFALVAIMTALKVWYAEFTGAAAS